MDAFYFDVAVNILVALIYQAVTDADTICDQCKCTPAQFKQMINKLQTAGFITTNSLSSAKLTHEPDEIQMTDILSTAEELEQYDEPNENPVTAYVIDAYNAHDRRIVRECSKFSVKDLL